MARDKNKSSGLLDPQVGNFLEGILEFSTQAVKFAASTSGGLTETLKKSPEKLKMMGEAGMALKDLRETAGMSLEELATAVNMEDPNIMAAIEEGKAALPMDVLMRLASVYSRNDPIPFVFRFARTYHPKLTEVLNKTGLDRLLLKAEREMKFIKIYRNIDAARNLSDEGFDKVLEFTNKAFVMAMHFVAEQENVHIEESEQEHVKNYKDSLDSDKAENGDENGEVTDESSLDD